jgi:hypothetical protein
MGGAKADGDATIMDYDTDFFRLRIIDHCSPANAVENRAVVDSGRRQIPHDH